MLLKLTFLGSTGRCAFLHSCYCCVCMLADPSVMSGLFCPMCLHMQLHPVPLNACGAKAPTVGQVFSSAPMGNWWDDW